VFGVAAASSHINHAMCREATAGQAGYNVSIATIER
jgi:hypothetical protein